MRGFIGFSGTFCALCAAVALAIGCAAPAQQAKKSLASTPPVDVHVYGKLRDIMHRGLTARRVDLNPLIGQRGGYALGALEGLKGEMTLWDGALWLSTPDGAGGATAANQRTTGAGATLLVHAKRSRWRAESISQSVSFSGLDAFIAQRAAAAGVDVREAFPFRIEGVVKRVDWHVIDGSKIPPGVHGHAAHIKTAVKGTLTGTPVKILGFYSPKHHAIFTHHDTNTHAHVICESAKIMGHVDHLDLMPGATLHLPESQAP